MIQDRLPARPVTVPRGLVEELLVRQRKCCALAVRREFDGHQRLPLRCCAPSPGEHELAVRYHLAECSAHVVLVAVRRAHHETVATADTRVALGYEQI